MSTLTEILAAARSLSPSDRSRLILALWESVSPEDWVPPAEEWIAEANRRSDSLDSGVMSAEAWPEVRKRARREAELDD